MAETPQEAQTFVDNFGITFPVLLDTQGSVFNGYRPPAGACVSPFPLDFVIDRSGIIRYWKCEYDATAMIDVIETLLTGGIGVPEADSPPAYRLRLTAAPNPAQPFTRLSYSLDMRAPIRLSLHDAQGRLVRLLGSEVNEPGTHHVLWDGRDTTGRPLPAGVYFVRLRFPGGETSRKLSLVR